MGYYGEWAILGAAIMLVGVIVGRLLALRIERKEADRDR